MMTTPHADFRLEPGSEVASLQKLFGLAVFGEGVAARTYARMAKLRPEYGSLMNQFSRMEATHGGAFAEVSRASGATLDRDFADRELGYLSDQVDRYFESGDFDALAVLQGFIVESLAIATYEPFLSVAERYPGAEKAFSQALADEHYHVDWITRYLRLRFFDDEAGFVALTERVNTEGIDCVGGTMMNIADHLQAIGLSGADCAGSMVTCYSELLEAVGIPEREAVSSVMGLFVPLLQKYRKQGASA